jgi:hypothetical protein
VGYRSPQGKSSVGVRIDMEDAFTGEYQYGWSCSTLMRTVWMDIQYGDAPTSHRVLLCKHSITEVDWVVVSDAIDSYSAHSQIFPSNHQSLLTQLQSVLGWGGRCSS